MKKIWTDAEIKYLSDNYSNHYLKKEHFIDYFNLDWKNIRQKAAKLKLARRSNKQFLCNEDYFEKIDSKDKAYFLGLLIADGNVTNKRFSITLQEKDRNVLRIFKEKIKYEGELNKVLLHKYNSKEKISRTILQIYSKKLSQDLTNLGCIPAKTYHTCFPDIPEELHSHFIRGVFDGDGCITVDSNKNNYYFFLTGTHSLLDDIQNKLIKYCSLKKNKLQKHRNNIKNNIYSLCYGGNNQVIAIYNWLYKDCDDLYLTRKKEKFEELCKQKQLL